MIIATNQCTQTIKLQVCYYRTPQCILMEVPGRKQKEAALGMLPSIREFRYEFREKF